MSALVSHVFTLAAAGAVATLLLTPKAHPLRPVALPPLVAPAAPAAEVVDDEHLCMAQVIYTEAAVDGVQGMALVAAVVLNRRDDKRWPDTVCAVARQPHQFEGMAHTAKIDQGSQMWAKAKALAAEALAPGWARPTRADHFANTVVSLKRGSHGWLAKGLANGQLKIDAASGGHVFFTSRRVR